MIKNFEKSKKTNQTTEALYTKQNMCNTNNNVILEIKEEQLDISKQWMQTGYVNVYRETFKVKKAFTIEVEREELVIESTVNKTQTINHTNINTNIIRIPLSEENVEFTKHRITLEDVSIYKQKIKDIKNIEATLKSEKLKVKILGDLKIKD